MEKRISSCFIVSLLLCLLTAPALHAQLRNNASRPSASNNRSTAQQPATKKEKKEPEITYPLFNGVIIATDVWGPVNHLLGSDFFSAEVSGEIDLKHRYFPVVELGYGSSNKLGDRGTRYKAGAPYFRIGMDYNILYHKKHGHELRLGLRYGATSFKYDVRTEGDAPALDDTIWNGTLPFDHSGMKGAMHWAEFCLGIRTHVGKNFYMGWGLRFKFKFSASTDRNGNPWYVPGYGKFGGKSMGIVYTVGYRLPIK